MKYLLIAFLFIAQLLNAQAPVEFIVDPRDTTVARLNIRTVSEITPDTYLAGVSFTDYTNHSVITDITEGLIVWDINCNKWYIYDIGALSGSVLPIYLERLSGVDDPAIGIAGLCYESDEYLFPIVASGIPDNIKQCMEEDFKLKLQTVLDGIGTLPPDIISGTGIADRLAYFSDVNEISPTTIEYSSTQLLAELLTGSFRLPTGTTAQRPGTPIVGDTRWNSTTGDWEFYNGTVWRSILEGMFNTGTSGEFAYFNSAGVVSDTTPAGLLSMIGGTGGTGVANQVAYWSGTSTLAGHTNFLWDGTELSVGTTNSAYTLDIGTGGVRIAPQSATPVVTSGMLYNDSDDDWFKGSTSSVDWFFARSDDVNPGAELIWHQNDANTAMTTRTSFRFSSNDNDGLVINNSDAGANGLNVRRIGSSGDIAAFETDAGTDVLSIEGTGIIDFEQGISGGAGLRWGTSGQTLFGVSGQGLTASFTNSGGNKSMEFNITATGDMACIGGNTIGSNPSQTGVFALTTFGGTTTTSTVTFRGADAGGSQTFGGPAIFRGGTGSTANSNGGHAYFRGGNQTSAWFGGGGIPGDMYFQTYNDSPDSLSHVTECNTPFTIMTLTNGPRYNIELYSLQEISGQASSDRVLVMKADTVQFEYRSFGEMHIQDTDPDTVSITAGSPAECIDWSSLVAQNFTFSAGRLTYTGTETARFLLDSSISATHSVAGAKIKTWLYYNNSKQQKTGSYATIENAGEWSVVSPRGTLTLATNDYIEIFFDSDQTGDIRVEQANLTITKL